MVDPLAPVFDFNQDCGFFDRLGRAIDDAVGCPGNARVLQITPMFANDELSAITSYWAEDVLDEQMLMTRAYWIVQTFYLCE